ncbi:uncharacterized protein LOC144138485 [Haemaphysalis longicornis]
MFISAREAGQRYHHAIPCAGFESIEPLLVQLESAAADLKHAADSTKTDVQKAFTELEKAVSHCSPPQCDVSDVEGFKGATEDFETRTEVSVSNVEQLKDELKNADIKQLVSQVPDVASLQEKMDELRVGLGSYLGTVRAALDLTRAKMNSTADLFIAGLRKLQDDPPSELKDLASVYEHSLTTIVVVMGVNVAIYIVGNHCSCSARRSGVCSYHAGAWLLSFGALLFLLSFWAPIIVSSVSLAVSAAFERLVCFPAQNLKSPETRPLIEFGYHWLFGTQGTLAKNESSSSKPSSKPLFDGRHDEGQPFSKQRRQVDGVQAAVKQSGTAGRRRAPPVLQAVMEGPLYGLETPDTALLDEEPSGNALQSADEDDFEHIFNQGDETTTAYPMPYILRKLLANRDRQDVTAFPTEGIQDTKNKRLPMPAVQSRDQSRDIPKLARRHHEDGHVGDQRKGPGYGSTYVPRHLHSVDYTAGKMTHVTSAKQYGELIGKVETPRAATHHPRKDTASGNRLSGKYVRLIRRNIVLEAVESPVLSSQHGDANSGALPEASAVRASYQGTSGAGDVDVVSFPRRRTVLRANRHGSDPKTNATQAAKRISLAAVRSRKDGFWGSEPNALELGRRSEQADVLSDQRSPNARGAIGKNEEKGDEAGADVSWEDALSSDAWKDSFRELAQSAGDGATEQSAESDGTLTFKALQTLVAPEDIREMAGRFSECERTRAPAFDVVGPKVAEAMAKMLLGVDSPWLGILVGNGQPKFPAVDAMMLNIGQPQTTPAIIETVLGSVADHVITPDDVTNIADKAKSAWKTMQGVVDARKRMKSWIAQPARSGQAKDDVERAGWLLDGISKDKVDALAKAADKIVAICNGLKDAVTVDNQPLQDYIKQNNARWKNLQDRETAAIGNLTDMASTAKRRLQDDIKQYFDHAKTQLQTNIGECLPLYTLYTTSLAAVCDRGTRPFAAFWMSVYLFFLLGVPAVLTALSVSTYYSRKAPETEPAAAGDEQ